MPKGYPVKLEDKEIHLEKRREESRILSKLWRERHPNYHKKYNRENRPWDISKLL